MEGTELTAAARGRSLCLWLLSGLSEPLARCVQDLESELGRLIGGYPPLGALHPTADQLARLAACIGAVDVAPLASEHDPLRLLVGLGDSVDGALPWQPPYLRDALTAFPAIRAALRPAAEAIASAPAAQWWDTAIDRTGQYELRDPADPEAGTTLPAVTALADLGRAMAHDEGLFRKRAADPAKEISDDWWSIPSGWIPKRVAVRLPSSSRRLPEIGAVELAAQEDSFGPDRVRLWRIEPVPPEVRVFEVRGPDDWARLVASYPFDVSRSRRGVWWQSTGIDGRWFLPDWPSVARDWDAVHVSVYGYLTTAGEPVPVPRGTAVLAGWNPDCTYWLCDITKDPAEERLLTSDIDVAHWRPTS